jgi:hypothetical protein
VEETMRQPASRCTADQRRREIELAFAYLFGPALEAQRIALDVLAGSIAPPPPQAEPAAAAPSAEMSASAVRASCVLRAAKQPVKTRLGAFAPTGATASLP